MSLFSVGDNLIADLQKQARSVALTNVNQNAGALAGNTGSEGALSGGRNWRELALNRPDPHMQFDWTVILQSPVGTFKAEYIEEIQVPNTNTEAEPIFRAAQRIYIAKSTDISAATIRVYEDNRMQSLQFFRQWYRLIQNPDGTFAVPATYKGYIICYPQDVKQNEIATITLSGVFPTKQPNLSLTSQNERTTYEIELSVDSIDIDFPNSTNEAETAGAFGAAIA